MLPGIQVHVSSSRHLLPYTVPSTELATSETPQSIAGAQEILSYFLIHSNIRYLGELNLFGL
jgi:hypothetical protein